ncbi:hypothetical protein [Streptomyces sp. TRM68367]|uniref:hypothetical protein n=1 Tax=Streptomyces sp. TRM68367 TaxID=2758415 RepID=UPI00165B9FB2|nr:hypothetical protein [Streptomyces sp. TRM68367]MBC9725149.1 hypothetical protein [Streptomyces sp. TRM68367]
MHKLKKAAAVAAVVGGMGLVGGGVAHADGYGDPYPGDAFIDNVQVVDCEQSFESDAITLTPGAGTGDLDANTGNFCTVIG